MTRCGSGWRRAGCPGWLPGLVRGNGNDGGGITLRRLLNHTSGLHNYTDDPDFQANTSGGGFPEHRYDTYTPEDLVAVAMKHPPHSAPGGEPRYSNTDYVLAGMVIEKATGTLLRAGGDAADHQTAEAARNVVPRHQPADAQAAPRRVLMAPRRLPRRPGPRRSSADLK